MLDFPILCTYEYKLEDLLPFAGKENFECLHWRGEEEGRGWREGIRREGEGKGKEIKRESLWDVARTDIKISIEAKLNSAP